MILLRHLPGLVRAEGAARLLAAPDAIAERYRGENLGKRLIKL